MNLTDIKELKESVRATLFSKALFIIENADDAVLKNLKESYSDQPWAFNKEIPSLSTDDLKHILSQWSVIENPNYSGPYSQNTDEVTPTQHPESDNDIQDGDQSVPSDLSSLSLLDLMKLAYFMDESEVSEDINLLSEELTPIVHVSSSDNTESDTYQFIRALQYALDTNSAIELFLDDGSTIDLDDLTINKILNDNELIDKVIVSMNSIEELTDALDITFSPELTTDDVQDEDDEDDEDESEPEEDSDDTDFSSNAIFIPTDIDNGDDE
jgi:hypothetical protein